MKYFMGIDVGTQAVKAGIFDERGDLISMSQKSYPTAYREDGFASQSPGDWWTALEKIVQESVKKSGLKRKQIVSLCVDGTAPTVLMVDNQGEPIGDAMLWCDRRATTQAEKIQSLADDEILKYSGGTILPSWILPKVLWLKENDHRYTDSYKILDCAEWITFRLTREFTASRSTLIRKANYLSHIEGWPDGFLKRINLEDFLGEKLPKKILGPGKYVGDLTADTAKKIGLKKGTSVIQGGIDSYVGLIGMGVHQDGQVGILMGSSIPIEAASHDLIFSKNLLGPYLDLIYPDMCFLTGVVSSGGSLARWVIDNSPMSWMYHNAAYDTFERKAFEIAPGSDNLLCLPYWNGVKAPIKDSSARGVFFGLSLRHKTEHLLKSVYEGIAYATRQCLDELDNIDYKTKEIVISGGGAKSLLFRQIMADVLGYELSLAFDESSLLGGAILASVGIGEHESIQDGIINMTIPKKKIEPDMGNHDIYSHFYESYKKIYPALKDVMHA